MHATHVQWPVSLALSYQLNNARSGVQRVPHSYAECLALFPYVTSRERAEARLSRRARPDHFVVAITWRASTPNHQNLSTVHQLAIIIVRTLAAIVTASTRSPEPADPALMSHRPPDASKADRYAPDGTPTTTIRPSTSDAPPRAPRPCRVPVAIPQEVVIGFFHATPNATPDVISDAMINAVANATPDAVSDATPDATPDATAARHQRGGLGRIRDFDPRGHFDPPMGA